MQLKAVGRISVGNLGFEVCWQIDDGNSAERALLWADTTSNTETLRNEGDFRFRCDFDTEFAASNHWARLLTLLSAFLRTTT